MFDQFQSRLNLKGEVETLTAIRIGAGRSTSPISAGSSRCTGCRESPVHPWFQFSRVCLGPTLRVSCGVSRIADILSVTRLMEMSSA